jgi:nicotinate-nucleotide adenylyltransferase
MGADSLRDLAHWKDPERIVELAEIGVAARPGVRMDLDQVHRVLPAATGRVTIVETPLIGISSTDLRQRAADGRPITYQVPEAVERYISDHDLYRQHATSSTAEEHGEVALPDAD